MNGENILMFPKSPAVLAEEWRTNSRKLDDEFNKLWRETELLTAALKNDGGAELAKVARDPDEVALAKLTASRLRAEKGSLFLHTGRKLCDWIEAWNKNWDDQKRAEKRAERFFGGAR